MARKRTRDPVLLAYEETEYGDLPWLDVPTEPGWYWFRVVPSTVTRGPSRVVKLAKATGMVMSGKKIEPGLYVHDGWSGWKPPNHFQRQWAGPLARPVPAENATETMPEHDGRAATTDEGEARD